MMTEGKERSVGILGGSSNGFACFKFCFESSSCLWLSECFLYGIEELMMRKNKRCDNLHGIGKGVFLSNVFLSGKR